MKPIVFNYNDYVKLKAENKRLREENTNLRIKCRILEADSKEKGCGNATT